MPIVLDSLTARQREVIHWRYIVGCRTDEQVAEHLGISRSAVCYRRLRALQRLQNARNVTDTPKNVTQTATTI